MRVGKGKLGPPNTVFHTCAISLMYTCKTGLLNWAVVAPGWKDVGDRNVGAVPQNKRPVWAVLRVWRGELFGEVGVRHCAGMWAG